MKKYALLSIAAIVALDRYTKMFFMLPSQRGELLFSPILELTQHKNFGIVANLPIPLFLTIAISILVLAVVFILLFRAIRRHHLSESFALSCIVGGAIGNLWDRLQWGYVFDWILLFRWSVINVADIAIALGLLWFVWLRSKDKNPKRQPS